MKVEVQVPRKWAYALLIVLLFGSGIFAVWAYKSDYAAAGTEPVADVAKLGHSPNEIEVNLGGTGTGTCEGKKTLQYAIKNKCLGSGTTGGGSGGTVGGTCARCGFDGTWVYYDDGVGNDFGVSCKDGYVIGWCNTHSTGLGYCDWTGGIAKSLNENKYPTWLVGTPIYTKTTALCSGAGGGGTNFLKSYSTVYSTQSNLPFSSTWVDSGLQIAVTPSVSGYKFLITASIIAKNGDETGSCEAGLFKDTTELVAPFLSNDGSHWDASPSTISYIDTATDTSSRTYKVKVRGNTNGACHINIAPGNAGYTGKSTMTIVEFSEGGGGGGTATLYKGALGCGGGAMTQNYCYPLSCITTGSQPVLRWMDCDTAACTGTIGPPTAQCKNLPTL